MHYFLTYNDKGEEKKGQGKGTGQRRLAHLRGPTREKEKQKLLRAVER